MKAKDWSPTHSQNQKLADDGQESHHIVQDAAARNAGDANYKPGSAPTTNLEGGSSVPGSPHDTANRMQQNLPLGGTYGAERDVGYLSLRAAGQTRGQAGANVDRADRYFEGQLGWNRDTPVPPPANRPVPPPNPESGR